MKNNYELLIFDIDGTLLDTSVGIYNSVRYAEKCIGLPPVSESKLKEFVGPPPKSTYMNVYGIDEKRAMEATEQHRKYGREKAIYEANVYPGVIELLNELKIKKFKLAVSTLKSQDIAVKILENFELNNYFNIIVGMDDSESLKKSDIIELAVRNTGTEGSVLMIGDSQYDLEGARKAGVDFVGVLYGFGFNHSVKYDFPTINNISEVWKYI